MILHDRNYYENLFTDYSDVVDLPTLRTMLGGVSESFVRRILQNGTIKSFRVGNNTFKIPKTNVIDYVVSESYQKYKHKLKVQI